MKKAEEKFPGATKKSQAEKEVIQDLLAPILRKLQHDLNQPLSAIMLYVQGSIRRMEANNYETDKIVYVLQQILLQSQKIEQIIKALKSNSDIEAFK